MIRIEVETPYDATLAEREAIAYKALEASETAKGSGVSIYRAGIHILNFTQSRSESGKKEKDNDQNRSRNAI